MKTIRSEIDSEYGSVYLVPNEELNRYNFPSQRKFDLNEIEPALRRQKPERREVDVFFWMLMAGVLIVSILHFVVVPLLTPVAHAEGYSNQTEVCSHITDPALNGTEAKMELLKMCN